MLITPSHFTFVKISLNEVLFSGFRKLQYLPARTLCLGKVSFRGLLLLHRDVPMLVAACILCDNKTVKIIVII